MKVLVNHTDLDAAGVLVVCRFYGIEFDKYILVNYDEINDKDGNYVFPQKYQITKEDDIVVTDVSPSKEMYEDIKNNSHSYIIFDHHDGTAVFKDDPNVFYDGHKCGTKLYFEWITEGKRLPAILQDFINVVDIYDNYNSKSPMWERALDLNRLFYQIQLWGEKGVEKLEWFVSSQIKKLKTIANDFYFTVEEQEKIKKAKKKEEEVYLKAKMMMKVRIDNLNNKFGVVVLDKKISYVLFRLLQERKDLAYIICINSYNGISGKLSIRIQEDNDLDANCFEKFEGHKKAGGGLLSVKETVDFWGGISGRKYFEYKEKNK